MRLVYAVSGELETEAEKEARECKEAQVRMEQLPTDADSNIL